MAGVIDFKGAARGAIGGGVVAGVICIALYFVGAAIGADFKPMHPEAMGGLAVLPFFQPMINCVIAALVSIGLVALLGKVAPAKAWNIYLGVAVVVFLLEAYAPFWAFADMKTIFILELMHLPPTLLIVGGIYKLGLKPATVAA